LLGCSSSAEQRCRQVVQAVLLAAADALAQLQQQQALTAFLARELAVFAKLSAVLGLTRVISIERQTAALQQAALCLLSGEASQLQVNPTIDIQFIYHETLDAVSSSFKGRDSSHSMYSSLSSEVRSADASASSGAHNAHDRERASSSKDRELQWRPVGSNSSSSSRSVAAAAERLATLGRDSSSSSPEAPTAHAAGSSTRSRSRAEPGASGSAAAGAAGVAAAGVGTSAGPTAAGVPAVAEVALRRKFCSPWSADSKDEVGAHLSSSSSGTR
jgi:hypothetical protein